MLARADVWPLTRWRQIDRRDPRERDDEQNDACQAGVEDTDRPAAWRGDQIGKHDCRQDEVGLGHLDVETEADECRREQQPAELAALRRPQRGCDREQRDQGEHAVDRIVATRRDADRCQGQRQCAGKAGDRTKASAQQIEEQGHRKHARQCLRNQQAHAGEAEQLCAEHLQPEAKGRLVDTDESARIEGREEEVVPILHHAAHGGGVIGVAIAEPAEVEET